MAPTTNCVASSPNICGVKVLIGLRGSNGLDVTGMSSIWPCKLSFSWTFHGTKEAVEASLDQIEQGDEVAVGSDFIDGFKAHQALGWRRLGPLGKVHNTAVHMRENDYRWNVFKQHAGRALAWTMIRAGTRGIFCLTLS